MDRRVLVCGLGAVAAIAGCGGAVDSHRANADAARTSAPISGIASLPCLVRPTLLPSAADMPVPMTRAEPLSYGPSIGYLGRTDPYPTYKGFGEVIYAWTGLTSGPAARFDVSNASTTSGNQAHDTNPVDNLPSSGPLFTDYPMQIFDVSLEIGDFGTVPAAERWMTQSRQSDPVNDIPVQGNLVRYITVPSLGDDTFAMQLDRSYAGGSGAMPQLGPFVGDVYTDIEVREGMYVYAASIDASPMAGAVTAAVRLLQLMTTREPAACGTTVSGVARAQ